MNRNGFDPTHAAYGGWGFDAPLQTRRVRATWISPTHAALQALAGARRWHCMRSTTERSVSDSRRRSDFLRVVQTHPDCRRSPAASSKDWHQSTVTDPYRRRLLLLARRAGGQQGPRGSVKASGAYFRSYATATCDGILALLGVRRAARR